jgi:peptidoglycan/LPS O-acetylase OafA/YrhL
LRGVAIVLVLACHYVGAADHARLGPRLHWALSAMSAGWTGVDLFFVLSGFLIGGILLDAREAPHYFKVFYVRRMHRIFPIYYGWILLYALICCGSWLWPGHHQVTHAEWAEIPWHIFFVQNMVYAFTTFSRIWFGPTWSLAVEEQFYLVAPPLFRFVSLRNIIYLLAAVICVTPFVRAVVFARLGVNGSYMLAMATPCRADTLAVGVLAAIAWRNENFRWFLTSNRVLLHRVSGIMITGAIALGWWLAHPLGWVTITVGYTWLALLFACLILTVMAHHEGWFGRMLRWKALSWLGMISYCVYLIHFAINEAASRWLLHTAPQVYNLRGVGATILALVITLAIASVSWRYIESPLIQRGHSHSYCGVQTRAPSEVPALWNESGKAMSAGSSKP